MTRAAIYARYSSDKQKPESIHQQESVCRAYCDRMQYDVLHLYADSATSGRSDDRPQFQLMVAEAAQYDVVVVYKLDRFARNRYDAANYKKLLKDAGCRLESATESTGDGIESVLLESLLEGMAEYYSRQLAQNTMRGMNDNAKSCKVNGMLPYGYKNVDGYYAVDEDEAAVVRRIFELKAAGTSNIHRTLCNVRTRRGGAFTQSMVSQILRNERYLGIYKWGDVEVQDGIPRIVSDELWARAHDRMGHGKRKVAESPMILHGILYGLDGEPAISQGSTASRTGKFYQYYVVDGRYEEARNMEHEVAEALRSLILLPDATEFIVKAVLDAQEQEGQDNVENALRDHIKALEKERANYVAAIAAIGAEPSILDEIKKRDEQIADAETKLAAHTATPRIRLDADMVEFALEMVCREDDDATLIRHFAKLAVCTEDYIRVWGIWDDVEPTRGELEAQLASVSENSKWCPSCEFIRNGFLVTVSRQ